MLWFLEKGVQVLARNFYALKLVLRFLFAPKTETHNTYVLGIRGKEQRSIEKWFTLSSPYPS